MSQDAHTEMPCFDDDDADLVAALARKATRKAARAANRVGYFVEHAKEGCIVKSPNHVVKVALKTSSIDVNKHYTFADAAR
jgi:hypothetical protein